MALEELYELWKQRVEETRPFQYMVQCEHWRDLILSVKEGVLVPRPESEELRDGLRVELGTGSGALAIAVAWVLGGGGGRVVAVDLSPVAALSLRNTMCRDTVCRLNSRAVRGGVMMGERMNKALV